MPKIVRVFNNLLPTWKQFRIGMAVAGAATLLHSTASFHLIMGIMIFVLFSFYLYLESMRSQISDLRVQVKHTPLEADNIKENISAFAKDIPATLEEEPIIKKDDIGQEPLKEGSVENDSSNLQFRFDQIESKLNDIDETILSLQNSLATVKDRLEKPVSIAELDFSKELPVNPEIQHNIQELSNKVESITELEKKVDSFQEEFNKMKNVSNEEPDIGKREMESRLIPLLRIFENRLSSMSQQSPGENQIEQVDQRVARLESKMHLMSNVIDILEKADQRFIDHENRLQNLSNSVTDMNEALNSRIDGISFILQDLTRRLGTNP